MVLVSVPTRCGEETRHENTSSSETEGGSPRTPSGFAMPTYLAGREGRLVACGVRADGTSRIARTRPVATQGEASALRLTLVARGDGEAGWKFINERKYANVK